MTAKTENWPAWEKVNWRGSSRQIAGGQGEATAGGVRGPSAILGETVCKQQQLWSKMIAIIRELLCLNSLSTVMSNCILFIYFSNSSWEQQKYVCFILFTWFNLYFVQHSCYQFVRQNSWNCTLGKPWDKSWKVQLKLNTNCTDLLEKRKY